MMFDDDQIALRDVARRFAREKLRPDYQKRESQPASTGPCSRKWVRSV